MGFTAGCRVHLRVYLRVSHTLEVAEGRAAATGTTSL